MEEPKRILMLNYEFPPLGGGASSVSYEIARGYVKLGYKVDVITMNYKGLLNFEIKDGINIHRTRCWRSKKEICHPWEQLTFLFSGFLKCKELLKLNKYDICHCHFIIPTGAIAYLLKKIYGLEYVITAHGSDVPGFNNDRFKFLHKFTGPFLRIIIKNSKKIIVPSEYLKNLIIKNITSKFNKKIKIIRNGIDTSYLKPQKKEKYIFSSGRLLPRKGFQYLIKAVSGEDIGFEVHIAGDGPMMEELKNLSKRSKTKIVFHGWMDNTGREFKNLIEKASIFVLASSKENASISLLEGMSAGCAMITTDISGCPETLGKAGLLIEPENWKDLLQKIKRITESEKKMIKLQKLSRKRAEDVFDWDVVIEEYINELGFRDH